MGRSMNKLISIRTKRSVSTTQEAVKADELVLQPKAPWYVRAIWRLLRRWRVWFTRSVGHESFTTVPIESKSILEAVDLAHEDLRRIYDRHAKFLVVGRGIAHKIVGELADRHCLMFGTEFPIGFNNQIEYRGITVVVCPWVEGYALLPELKELR
jgi:hypothetical protein